MICWYAWVIQSRILYIDICWREHYFNTRRLKYFAMKREKGQGRVYALLGSHAVNLGSSVQHYEELMNVPEKITFVSKYYHLNAL